MSTNRDHHGRLLENGTISFSREIPYALALPRCLVSVHPKKSLHIYFDSTDPVELEKAARLISKCIGGEIKQDGHSWTVYSPRPALAFNLWCECELCKAKQKHVLLPQLSEEA